MGDWNAWLEEHRSDSAVRRLEPMLRRVLERADIADGDRVLDIGTGLGLVAAAAAAATPAGLAVGIDSDLAAIWSCSERNEGHVVGLAANAETLPFASHSFDVVTTFCVFIYVNDKSRAMAEILRVLKPGGRVVLFEPVHQARLRHTTTTDVRVPQFEDAHRELVDQQRRLLDDGGRVLAAFTADQLADWFIAAGFDMVTMRYDFTHRRTRGAASEHRAALARAPIPGYSSYEERARERLGDAAAEVYLTSYSEQLATTSWPVVAATVTLSATKPG